MANDHLNILIATRNRPQAVMEVARAFHASETDEQRTLLTFVIDDDDPKLGEYKAKVESAQNLF